MTDKDYNEILEYERMRAEYMLRYEPERYYLEQETRKFYNEKYYDELKCKEFQNHIISKKNNHDKSKKKKHITV